MQTIYLASVMAENLGYLTDKYPDTTVAHSHIYSNDHSIHLAHVVIHMTDEALAYAMKHFILDGYVTLEPYDG